MSLHIHMPKLWSSWRACNLQELTHWWKLSKTKALLNGSKSVRMRHQRQCLEFALCSTGKNPTHSLNLWTFLSFPCQGIHSINSLWSRSVTTYILRGCISCLHARDLKTALKFLAHCSPICMTFVCNRFDMVENFVPGLHICKVLQCWARMKFLNCLEKVRL